MWGSGCGSIASIPRSRIHGIIAEKLAIVGLEGREGLRTSELSGGMRKRVAIARSLAMEPDLVLYDEPTAELDPVTTDELAETILSLKKKTGNTTIIVTHDLNFALYLSDRIAMMHQGRSSIKRKKQESTLGAGLKQVFLILKSIFISA